MQEKRSAKPAELYTWLINKLHLTPEDRADLKKKRGFRDDVIDLLKFKSGGPHVAQYVEEMKSQFLLPDIFRAGLILKSMSPSPHLIDPKKIIIPYLTTDMKEVRYIKCHKKGNLQNIGVEPYSELTALTQFDVVSKSPSRKHLVLCESEFKAAAMWQLGYRAVGLGGIATFSGQHLEKLMPLFLKETDRIIIMFDQEIQDNPEFVNFKEDPRSRFAHYIWSYVMAMRLEQLCEKNDIKTEIRIATIPKDWTIDGKADCDSALAAGHTPEEFMIIMSDVLDAKTYRDMLDIPDEDAPWVNRKMERAVKNKTVFDQGGCYFKIAQKKVKIDGEFEVKTYNRELSNFKIVTGDIIFDGGVCLREIWLKSMFGDRSRAFILRSDEMASYKEFKKKCLSQGDFLWKGDEKDWADLIEDLFMQTTGRTIYTLDQIGRRDDENRWVFGNMIIKDDGAEIPISQETFWDGYTGYRIAKLAAIPKLSKEPIDANEVLSHFYKAWGIAGILGFAYSISCLFYYPIFESTKAFPMAMIHGEKESGKSTLSDMMVSLLGFPTAAAAMNTVDTTQVAISRKLRFYSSLPVRLDEFRQEDKKTTDKFSFLRSVYNRQSSAKGTKTSYYETREVEVNGTAIITGEQVPEDPALMSRMLPIHVTGRKSTESARSVTWLYDHADELSYITYSIIKNYRANSDRFMKFYGSTRKGFSEMEQKSPNFRLQNHFAQALAALNVVFKPEDMVQYQKVIVQLFEASVTSQKESSILGRFFRDIKVMHDSKEPVIEYFNPVKDNPSQVFIYFAGLYPLWARFRKGISDFKSLFSEQTLRDYMKVQPYTIAVGIRDNVSLTKGSLVRGVVIDLTLDSTPEALKELCEGIHRYDHGF